MIAGIPKTSIPILAALGSPSKTELTEHIYGQDFDRDSNTIEVLVNRLRKKFGAAFIHTHRGQGYQIEQPDTAP